MKAMNPSLPPSMGKITDWVLYAWSATFLAEGKL